MSTISITSNSGFHMKFDNGFTISVQFGYGNYCGNKFDDRLRGGKGTNVSGMSTALVTSTDAEIMIWRNEEERCYVPKNHPDAVIGWVSGDKVGQIIGMLSTAKSSRSVKIMLTKILK